MKKNLRRLNENNARIERVIYLAGAIAGTDTLTEDLVDFFDDDIETVERCLGKLPSWMDPDDARTNELAEDICHWIYTTGRIGFLVQFATPVMEIQGGSCRRFSWGYYSTRWIYAETVDDAIDQGLAWVKERRLSEELKAAQKSGAA